MSDVLCPHCGHPHSSDVAYCPTTGRQVRAAAPGLPLPDGSQPPAAAASALPPPPPPAAAAAPPAQAEPGPGADATAVPDKGVADILREAYELYRKHFRMLITTCALLFVPAAIVNSCARSVILGPTERAAADVMGAHARDVEESARVLQEAYNNHAAPATIARLQAENAQRLEELSRRSIEAAGATLGNMAIFMLGLLGTLVTAFFLYGVVVPLTNGALTIAVADRVLGGSAGWREVWMLLFRRLGLLLSAVIPAGFLIAVGWLFLLIPGIVLGLLFAFVSPVVLIEGLRGRAALKRSVALVRSDWLRVAIVIFVFSVLCWAARVAAHLLIPSSAIFAASLFTDLFTLVLLPVPILGLVLLYFDIRRKHEGFTSDRLRADLEALRSA